MAKEAKKMCNTITRELDRVRRQKLQVLLSSGMSGSSGRCGRCRGTWKKKNVRIESSLLLGEIKASRKFKVCRLDEMAVVPTCWECDVVRLS